MPFNRNRSRSRDFPAPLSVPRMPVWLAAIPIALLAGCATPRASTPTIPPAADTAEVVAYPLHNQSERQIRQDRYECYLWAVRQSGYDPATQTGAVETGAVVVSGPPEGSATVAGTVTGAAVGALVSGPRRGGAGAAVGAIVGALAGASVDAENRARADEAQASYEAAVVGEQNRQIRAYRRALSACLDARGYSVR